MDSILVRSVSSPPFECSNQGLTYKGHSRESITKLKSWLFPRQKNSAPLKRAKDWWLAQHHLYGVKFKTATTVAALTEGLKDALTKGLQGPPESLIQLEAALRHQLSIRNKEEWEKRYLSLDDNAKAEFDSFRFLREKFTNGKEELMVLKIGLSSGEVHYAAEELGLHTVSACAPPGDIYDRWIVVGRNKAAVSARGRDLDKKRRDWEDEQRNAKRQKVEANRKEMEAGGKGKFADVEGEWRIACDKMDKEYRKAVRKMSIFFQRPRQKHDSEDSEYNSGCEYDSSSDAEKDERLDANSTPLMLQSNFEMGILEGVLRATRELPLSSSFPVKNISFTWQGRETGEGEIQLDYEGDVNTGHLTFLSKTQVTGVLNSSYGNFPFSGSKVSQVPVNKEDTWGDLDSSQYERERVSRW